MTLSQDVLEAVVSLLDPGGQLWKGYAYSTEGIPS